MPFSFPVTHMKRAATSGRPAGLHLLNDLMISHRGAASGASTTTTDNAIWYDYSANARGYFAEKGSAGDGIGVTHEYNSTIACSCAKFDRLTNDYLWMNTTDFQFGDSLFTGTFRIRNTNGNGDRGMIGSIDNTDSGASWSWRVFMRGSVDKLVLQVSTDGSTSAAEVVSTITISSYHSCQFGRDASNIWIIVDGETKVTTAFSGTLASEGTLVMGKLDPGGTNTNSTHSNILGELNIWDDALNDTEIADLWGGSLTAGSELPSWTT